MAKIRAVLDQETWVEVDVPDEFQAIVISLCSSEALISENLDHVQNNVETNHGEVIAFNDGSLVEDTAQGKPTPLAEAANKNKASLAHCNDNKMKEHGKSTSQTLSYKGVGYHMVNWLVILFYFYFYFLFILIFFLLGFVKSTLVQLILLVHVKLLASIGHFMELFTCTLNSEQAVCFALYFMILHFL